MSTPGSPPRPAVAIGDRVLDLAGLTSAGLLDAPPGCFDIPVLNGFLAAGRTVWNEVRSQIMRMLVDPAYAGSVEPHLHPAAETTEHLPIAVGDYVDFYSSMEHATNLGRIFRPDGEPLLPNWRHLPVGYHGRAGTVVGSGTDVERPNGQLRRPDGSIEFGPSEKLDIELELGFVLGGSTSMGEHVDTTETAEHVFGVVLVNDWSARDIQSWEYQPLGPFLGKSFATTMSNWIVPIDALGGARTAGPAQDPEPLPYLERVDPWALDLDLEVWMQPDGHAAETRIASVNAAGLYWTVDQQLAHLTANGASIRSGDLIATGTISGPGRERRDGFGSLMELSWNGTRRIPVGRVERTFLADGDTIELRGWAEVGGHRVDLGPCRGTVVAAR